MSGSCSSPYYLPPSYSLNNEGSKIALASHLPFHHSIFLQPNFHRPVPLLELIIHNVSIWHHSLCHRLRPWHSCPRPCLRIRTVRDVTPFVPEHRSFQSSIILLLLLLLNIPTYRCLDDTSIIIYGFRRCSIQPPRARIKRLVPITSCVIDRSRHLIRRHPSCNPCSSRVNTKSNH